MVFLQGWIETVKKARVKKSGESKASSLKPRSISANEPKKRTKNKNKQIKSNIKFLEEEMEGKGTKYCVFMN